MSGGGAPPDNSLAVEQQREQAQKEAQAAADAKAEAHKGGLANLRAQARGGATGSVDDYFSSQGVDPTQYAGSIESQLNNILSGISPSDENPGASFTGAGQSIWDKLTTGATDQGYEQVGQILRTKLRNVREYPRHWMIRTSRESKGSNTQMQMPSSRTCLIGVCLPLSGYGSAEKDLENQRAGVTS